jgi:hypothetical protein
MTLEDQIIQESSRKLVKHYDFEVLASLSEWHRIDIDRLQDNHHAVDITYWLANNCTGKYHRNGRHFLFESQKDAVLFQLRWA